MGRHDAAGGHPLPAGRPASVGYQRESRSRVVLVVAASITWLFTIICLIGVVADTDPSARLGFVILGVPFLAAALATTYGARSVGSREQAGAGEITRAARGGGASVPVAASDELDLDNLPDGTTSVLEAMRRSYAELDAKLSDDDSTSAGRSSQAQCSTVCAPRPATSRTVSRPRS